MDVRSLFPLAAKMDVVDRKHLHSKGGTQGSPGELERKRQEHEGQASILSFGGNPIPTLLSDFQSCGTLPTHPRKERFRSSVKMVMR